MAKFNYWHLVTEINPEECPVGIKVGVAVTHYRKHNGRVAITNFVKKKQTWVYTLKYLKRLPKDMPLSERCDILKELANGVKSE